MNRRLFAALFALLASTLAAQPARFIVELTSEPAVVRPQAERQARRAGLAVEQEDFLRNVRAAARTSQVVDRLTMAINAVIIDADEADYARIAALPGVKRVERSRELQLHLERALSLHSAPAAWAAGKSRGAGMKIAILDTGIDHNHPGFKPPEGMRAPDGYPQSSPESNRAFVNGKIIVARSFDIGSVADTYGHGTAVAMVAAGVEHSSPRGTISGIAPDAWLGVYKVARTGDNAILVDYVLRALEAALADQMDVINMSLGSVALMGYPEDLISSTANRIAESGVLVINSAGNAGPELMSLDGTASAPLVIGVGSTLNDRISVNPAVELPDGNSLTAAASSNATPATPNRSLPIMDSASVDSTSLLCSAVPADSFKGKIPLIRRGDCNFTVKLENAFNAGAEAAIVYNRPDDASPNSIITMSVDERPTIPGLFVGYDDGVRLKEAAAAAGEGGYVVRVRFTSGSNPNTLSNFSSLGPSVDLTIKPDLVATGSSVFTAGQALDPSGPLYSTSGYLSTSGTSFSAPMVAGAAAVLKAARPGLHASQYRSLLVNSTRPLFSATDVPMPLMRAGAGALNLETSILNSLAAEPVSVSFGAKGSTVDMWKQIIVRNVSATTRNYSVELRTKDEVKPWITDTTLRLDPGAIAGPVIGFTGDFAAGAYQGFVVFKDEETSIETRVPYWLAVRSSVPAAISAPIQPSTTRAGSVVTYYLRVHDAAGVPINEAQAEAAITQGNSELVVFQPSSLYQGLWWMRVRVGAEVSAVTIRSGEATRVITIRPS